VPRHDPFFAKAPAGALFVCHVLFSLVLLLPVAPAMAGATTETAAVRYAVDGDSVTLADDRPVRLIGINAPELGRDGAPDQPLAAAARGRLRELVQGKTVQLRFESESRDRHGRWLAHLVLADGTSAGIAMLKSGLAWAVAIPPNIGEHAAHQAAEAEARRARLGVWGHSYYDAHDPAGLTSADTGFRLVRGRVSHVGRSRKYVYLDMGARFALRIAHADWQQYFRGRPEAWQDAEVEARGWLADHDGRLHMTLGHPAMIERRR